MVGGEFLSVLVGLGGCVIMPARVADPVDRAGGRRPRVPGQFVVARVRRRQEAAIALGVGPVAAPEFVLALVRRVQDTARSIGVDRRTTQPLLE